MIIDEISLIGRQTFEHLDLPLKVTMQNSLLSGGVSLLVVVDFSQLLLVNQRGVFMKTIKGL